MMTSASSPGRMALRATNAANPIEPPMKPPYDEMPFQNSMMMIGSRLSSSCW